MQMKSRRGLRQPNEQLRQAFGRNGRFGLIVGRFVALRESPPTRRPAFAATV